MLPRPASALRGVQGHARRRRVLVEINKQAGVRPHRPAILSACLRTLNSCDDADGFHELAMAVREQQRMVGREIKGKAVGSTLLLKGLEADVAVLLDTASFSAQEPLRTRSPFSRLPEDGRPLISSTNTIAVCGTDELVNAVP